MNGDNDSEQAYLLGFSLLFSARIAVKKSYSLWRALCQAKTKMGDKEADRWSPIWLLRKSARYVQPT